MIISPEGTGKIEATEGLELAFCHTEHHFGMESNTEAWVLAFGTPEEIIERAVDLATLDSRVTFNSLDEPSKWYLLSEMTHQQRLAKEHLQAPIYEGIIIEPRTLRGKIVSFTLYEREHEETDFDFAIRNLIGVFKTASHANIRSMTVSTLLPIFGKSLLDSGAVPTEVLNAAFEYHKQEFPETSLDKVVLLYQLEDEE